MNFEDYESLPTTNVQTHMVAGAAAGVMEHCVMYPLDSVKQCLFLRKASVMTSTDDYESLTVNNYKSVYKMGLPEDKSSLSLPHDKSQAVSQSVSMDDYESIPSDKLSHIMMAGATAGIMEHCVMFPFDTIKTRMQSLTTSSQTGRGMGEVFRGMVAQEGVLRPLRGVNAVILGAAPAHALYFSCYEYLKDTFTNRTLINNNVGYGLAGGMATMLHDGIMTPADVVKQRLQMYNSPYRSMLETIRTVYRTEGLVAFYRSYTTQLAMNVPFQSIHFITYEVIYYTIRTVYRTEGLVAFYRSYTTQLAMNVPFQSIHFITYEVMQTITNPSRSYNPIAHMMSGAISGGVAAAITTPLDVCKTFLNTQQSKEKISGLFGAIRSVYKLGGPLGFFRGLQARVLYQMPSTAICWSTYELFKYLLTVSALPLTDEESESASNRILPLRRDIVDQESPSILPHPSVTSDKTFGVTKFTESDCWSSGGGGGNPYNKPALAFTTVHGGEKTEIVNTRLLDSTSTKLPMETAFRSF
ncbi:hypothetical protein M8J77_010032 [Diaphorina citri]|nr:hypothetical protein M8J77_010032 [Diaphorina citri]